MLSREVKSALVGVCVCIYIYMRFSNPFLSVRVHVHPAYKSIYIYIMCVCVRVAQLFIKNCERAAEKIKESGQKSLRANLYGPFIALGAHRIIYIYIHPTSIAQHRPVLKNIYTRSRMCVIRARARVCICTQIINNHFLINPFPDPKPSPLSIGSLKSHVRDSSALARRMCK